MGLLFDSRVALNLATIVRPRFSGVIRQFARDQHSSRPLFCLKNFRRDGSNWSLVARQMRGLANTTSGFYAPSTMTGRKPVDRQEAQGNLSVYEDSDQMPSLPVPNLNITLEKLKESVSPVAMNSIEFARTLTLIDEFAKSAGPKLDSLLRCKAKQTKNWMTHDWWVNEIYLKSRQPLVINSNPSMIFPKLPFEVASQRAVVDLVSQFVSCIIDFKISLMNGYNPEATCSDNEFRLEPSLCYHQYKNIFGSTRVPGEQIDSVKFVEFDGHGDAFNLVVSFRGKFFEIQINDIENEKDRVSEIAVILDKIISSVKHEPQDITGAGVLTTTDRTNWAKTHRLLDSDSMSAIEAAQFVVCIDTIAAGSEDYSKTLLEAPSGSESHLAALGRQVLHGDSSNVGNRWFDKSLQLVVVTDENADRFVGAGINYEHSFAEGVVIAKMIEYCFDRTLRKYRSNANDDFFAKQQVLPQKPAVFRQLKMFNSNNRHTIATSLKQARQDFASQVNQFDLSYLAYKNYGSNAIKSWRCSPDSWFQVALLSGYYALHKRLGPCYESASTRRFAYGRTETIRSLTKEVAEFCQEPKYDTLQAAVASHKKFANSAIVGEAIDRVLMGYRMTFNELRANNWVWGIPAFHNVRDMNENNESSADVLSREQADLAEVFSDDEIATITAFFNSELIQRSTRYALSTSQVPSIHPDIYMSFGPLLADGYGCCYNISGHKIVAAITANSSNQSFSCEVHQLNEVVKEKLDHMRDIVEAQRFKGLHPNSKL